MSWKQGLQSSKYYRTKMKIGMTYEMLFLVYTCRPFLRQAQGDSKKPEYKLIEVVEDAGGEGFAGGAGFLFGSRDAAIVIIVINKIQYRFHFGVLF